MGIFLTLSPGEATAINDSGEAVGNFTDASALHAFIYVKLFAVRADFDPVGCSHVAGEESRFSGPVNTPGSTGELITTSATMAWSASNSLGFRFVSNPSGTTSAFAQLGRVQNGVFAD